jgi:hypothetical protein
MKRYLTFGLGFLAVCTSALSIGCSEQSGWGAGYGGMQLQQDAPPTVQSGAAPEGSGAVNYVPHGNF